MHHRLIFTIAAALIYCGVFVGQAVGMDEYVRDVAEKVSPQETKERRADFVIMPIPVSNPTIGSGLALATMFLYDVGENAPTSNTTLGALYTDSKSWGLGFSQKTYLRDDKFRLNAAGGYFDLNLDFYGIGADAGDRGISIPLNQTGFIFVPEFMTRVSDNLYFGIRYRLLTCTTALNAGNIGPISLPRLELDVTTSGLGIVMNYDTRDNPLNPTEGTFADFKATYPTEALGSDRDYQIYETAYNRYMQVTQRGVLALGLQGKFTSGNVPFFDLSYFMLRGYVGGQYRDKHMVAAQAEYRWQALERVGLVFFGGVGSVAPAIDKFDFDDLLPSGGVGLRIMASKEQRVNVSIDYAFGRDSEAFYFSIGEAF
jgi:outer membrane protein assembly factor BamA